MITDSQTNQLYLADTLTVKHPDFYPKFKKLLDDCDIEVKVLQGTKDIWAVDYMPIQVKTDKFVKFNYSPDYLVNYKKYKPTISDVSAICEKLPFHLIESQIILDGGNVVNSGNKVIMCDKIFTENVKYPRRVLSDKLRELFEVDELYFVPQQKRDYIGHADGLVRFYDENTVLINKYSEKDREYERVMKLALDNAGLNYIEIPYNPYGNKKFINANGIYINYLQMEKAIVLPVFGMKEDEEVVRLFEKLFAGKNIVTIDSNSVAEKGGILNCISWNIKNN